MKDLNARLSEREISVELSDDARKLIVDEGYDPIYGARPLKRYIQKTVETLAAKLILSGSISQGDTILIEAAGEDLKAVKK